MAELKTKDGLVVGLIIQSPDPPKEKSEGKVSTADNLVRKNRVKSYDK